MEEAIERSDVFGVLIIYLVGEEMLSVDQEMALSQGLVSEQRRQDRWTKDHLSVCWLMYWWAFPSCVIELEAKRSTPKVT